MYGTICTHVVLGVRYHVYACGPRYAVPCVHVVLIYGTTYTHVVLRCTVPMCTRGHRCAVYIYVVLGVRYHVHRDSRSDGRVIF